MVSLKTSSFLFCFLCLTLSFFGRQLVSLLTRAARQIKRMNPKIRMLEMLFPEGLSQDQKLPLVTFLFYLNLSTPLKKKIILSRLERELRTQKRKRRGDLALQVNQKRLEKYIQRGELIKLHVVGEFYFNTVLSEQKLVNKFRSP